MLKVIYMEKTHTFIIIQFLRSKVQNMPHFIKGQVVRRAVFSLGGYKG